MITAEETPRKRDPIAQPGPYIVLSAPDGSGSAVVHQPTGRTVWSSDEKGHQAAARIDARSRNERGQA